MVVAGSVALDSIETPSTNRKDLLGGSACFACLAASFFSNPGLLGIVGRDFPVDYTDLLEKYHVDLIGLQRDLTGNTFRWAGVYNCDMNSRRTLSTDLGVFCNFSPRVPDSYRKASYVLLANISPGLQLEVLDQIENPVFVAADTMDLWINTERENLLKLHKRIDLLFLNDSEAEAWTGMGNPLLAAGKLLEDGPKYVVIKKGSHGSMLFSKDSIFVLPAVPLEECADPTGAGDSFAGGFMGFLAGKGEVSWSTLKEAMAFGTALASFCVESFSADGFRSADLNTINARVTLLREISKF
ncbi:MAG: sugar kinase [Lentisphaerae bacterium]|nr:sugar kinase [Lentisphaerota bacterium]